MFNFGVVLYNTRASDILRLARSVDVACRYAGADYRLMFLRNSDEPLDIPDEVTRLGSVIKFSSNLGFGQGHNEIARTLHSTGGFYVGLNPDGFLSPWAISAARSWHPISGNLYEFRQDSQEHPKVFDPQSGHTAWSSGAAFMIDLRFFLEIGGFDPNFFMYCEDVDLSWRVHERGGKCVMMANATFFHDVSDNRQSPEVVARMLAGQALLATKWNARSVSKSTIERLRRLEAKHGLPEKQIPEIPEADIRSSTPSFCDFSRSGSYSETRW